jgi:hypothetical protein
MKFIALNHGYSTKVSDVDYDWLMTYCWRADTHTASGKPYVCTTVTLEDGKRTTVYMHRLITDCPMEYRVDHWDRDTLNNQRPNLRITNFDGNHANRAGWGRAGYKGVTRRGRRWRARITLSGVEKHLGYFDSAVAAALAYDEAAVERFGEFAYLNFPENYQTAIPDYDIPDDIPF